jgi:hypothetical protein
LWEHSFHVELACVRSDYPRSRLWLRPLQEAWGRLDVASEWPVQLADCRRIPNYPISIRDEDRGVPFCKTCVIPILTCLIESSRYAVVNVNTFDNVDQSEFVEAATDFEGETVENRLARRHHNWTPEAVGPRD